MSVTAPPQSEKATALVLYIEDEEVNQRIMATLARRVDGGVSLVAAMTGEQARAILDGPVPDLILLDLDLPDMNGRDILIDLRRSGRTGNVPVVVVSAQTDPQKIAELLAAGADGYITKPFDVTQILHLLAHPSDASTMREVR